MEAIAAQRGRENVNFRGNFQIRPFKLVSGGAQGGVHQGKQQVHTGAGDSPQRHPTAREKDTSERARERERERERERAREKERERERERER